ncbi:MsnO8 family LLM class oxidoreductase [Paenibacillus barcinonensis]|uniref:Luciferase family oxidoreductase group 1 n=1 Tax=Paenibacillus barcinonensis TaxID=198119 RepID=A0A2V4W1V6_PAEBA|nr:MsnO8 family LLM class oxidoreductase [Paenibacillus barcinonensis]PYE48471.1 luciferase family oxidoreductase group 1 [Paenibacillus barcinonensis]QKS58820.1 MsnO8 family LLM class oxidoreductase [Paenibacillus barcinonensis]
MTLEENISLGVLDLVPRLNGATAEQALQQAVLLAQRAEAWGYARYWTSEHHDMAELASAAPEVLLAHIGAVIQLGSGAVLLPHYSPLKVAESFRLLASLYPGRIELGLGRAPGGGPHAAMALSGNYLQHVSKLPESLASLTRLLEDRYTYEDVPVVARPVPEAPLSLWMLGTNLKSADLAAQFGMGYVFGQFMSDSDGVEAVRRYRDQFVPSAHLKHPVVMAAISVICAASESEALGWSREIADQRRENQQEQSHGERPDGSDLSSARDSEDQGGSSNTHVLKHIAGTPEQVWQQLDRLAQRLNTDRILVVTAGPDYERRLESYRLLAAAKQDCLIRFAKV